MTVAIFSLVACRSDTVLLTYRYPSSSVTSYVMQAHANASWDLGEEPADRGSYRVTYEVTETVQAVAEGEAVVVVEMEPVSVSAAGLPPPDRGVRSFTLRLGPRGELLDILEVDGIPAVDLEPDEIAFIGTYRPPLPRESVRLAERWQSQQEFHLESVFQQLLVVGRLEALDRDAAGSHAVLAYEGDGPLVWTIELPGGDATLTGEATTRADAVLELDSGVLRSATSTTRGRFDVRVLPTDEVSSPLTGTLSFQIEVEVRRAATGEPQPASSTPTTT